MTRYQTGDKSVCEFKACQEVSKPPSWRPTQNKKISTSLKSGRHSVMNYNAMAGGMCLSRQTTELPVELLSEIGARNRDSASEVRDLVNSRAECVRIASQ